MQNSPRHLRHCNIYCCFSDTGVLIPQDYKHTDPDCPLTTRPFFKGQNNQKLCLSFCHSLVSHHTSFFCTIYCIKFWFFLSVIPSPKHSQCIKPLQYLCWPCFLGMFLVLLVKTVLFASWGDSFN